MQAVILAAGMGTRIRDHFVLPKGFIPLGGQPIILASIEKLKAAGIQEIVIVAGHLAEYYVDLAKQDAALTVIKNPYFNVYSSLYSLYCAKDWVSQDFLLLESDIFYEQRALEIILADINPNSILLSGKTDSGDEVYVQSEAGKLVAMSKQLDPKKAFGEFVGINKLSLGAFQTLIKILEKDERLLQRGYYEEDGLVRLAKTVSIHCLKIENLLWSEIDNIQQLHKAKNIYEKIRGMHVVEQ